MAIMSWSRPPRRVAPPRTATRGKSMDMARRGPAPSGRTADLKFRTWPQHMQHYRELAEREGVPLGQYLALKLAAAHDLDCPEEDNDQLALGA